MEEMQGYGKGVKVLKRYHGMLKVSRHGKGLYRAVWIGLDSSVYGGH